MSAANLIYNEINLIPSGIPFTIAKFKQYVNATNLRKILSRLTQNGIIERITSNIYAKPEVYRGYKVILTGEPLVKCIEETTGEIIVTFGASAINQLGITTQLPMQEIYYYTGKDSHIIVNNKEIKLVHINKKYVNKSNVVLELVLSAAYFLGKGNFTINTLYTVERKLSKQSLLELSQYMPQMPQWLSSIFFEYYKALKSE